MSGSLTERSDVLEWLWNFSEWKFSEVGHDWLLGELHELLLSLEAVLNMLESVLRYQIWLPNVSVRIINFRRLLTLNLWWW